MELSTSCATPPGCLWFHVECGSLLFAVASLIFPHCRLVNALRNGFMVLSACCQFRLVSIRPKIVGACEK
jgi:hypothetical protein